MFRSLALLCTIAASAFAGSWQGGFRVRFDVHGVGTTAFIELPQSATLAAEKGWVRKTGPVTVRGVLDSLALWCPESDYTVCALYDDTDYIAGLQVALNEETYSGGIFDWFVQGFTPWTTDMDGVTQKYWTTQQYYITPETLATDPADRIAARNPNLMLQDHTILVSGFYRALYPLSTDISEITSPNSDYTKQACIPGMGQHYYYKTTVDMECKSETMFPWFPLMHSDQLIGVGLVVFGKHTVKEGAVDWFETPSRAAVEAIVPRGPQCLYDLADAPGLITLHTYFINEPFAVACN